MEVPVFIEEHVGHFSKQGHLLKRMVEVGGTLARWWDVEFPDLRRSGG
jgi:hypothetical protein